MKIIGYIGALVCLAVSVAGLSSCEKEQGCSPVYFSCSFDAKGGRKDYNVDLDGASLTLNIDCAYSGEDIFSLENYEWVDAAYYPELKQLSIFSSENDTGLKRKAVVSGSHRVSGRKYVFEIEQSE